MMTLRMARWRARHWLRGQTIRRLGLDKEFPPIGTIRAGQLSFEVERVEFRAGQMVVHGTAGATEAGAMAGQTFIDGTDGTRCWVGHEDLNMGVKPAGSTWKYAYDVRLIMPARTVPDC